MNKQAKLLLVDSNQPSLKAMRCSLETTGYRVYTASNKQDAARLNNLEKPNLVILNNRLIGSIGLDLADTLLDSGSPFIFYQHQQAPDPLHSHETGEDSAILLRQDEQVSSLIACIESLLKQSFESEELKGQEQHYIKAIETGKIVGTVVGILMERHRLNRANAFDLLRTRARSQRRSLVELAQEILDALETLTQVSE
ncbi:MAG: response regulator [Candidatus Thiodiazotropha lotti]|uniref:ANTAR domain-containing protein n=1 Tax=Candidatus Thiodiazotropha endoloripes TaxID=1818881 RepID=A0A1E2UPD9_9GAMM|nr:response regulator [Candidatus Thiodiazotropha endoloripes]MCG7900691.1 response regulator [Candidatus Thiodiazotropha weberae]MCG7993674.1 response regulator [Candidatus Thiodiazotropha lotti]MCG7904125.1 response regulator [Candidatus Thiodiazotropha weberae]MCG7912964.1 response regulator [Candidatus Thiodiazotropha weberae]MCG8000876.1 response regulator [Candidatus Thiodiazotropha lotti]